MQQVSALTASSHPCPDMTAFPCTDLCCGILIETWTACAYARVCMYAYMCACMNVCMYVHVSDRLYVSRRGSVCMYACMHVCKQELCSCNKSVLLCCPHVHIYLWVEVTYILGVLDCQACSVYVCMPESASISEFCGIAFTFGLSLLGS
jgi:hypothetical protein